MFFLMRAQNVRQLNNKIRSNNMGKLTSEKYVATAQHKSNLRNIRGTFAVEGMTISESTRSNLDRIASGQTSYQQVLTELRAKYEKRG